MQRRSQAWQAYQFIFSEFARHARLLRSRSQTAGETPALPGASRLAHTLQVIPLIIVVFFFAACAKPVQNLETAPPADPLQDIKQTVRSKFPSVKQLSTNDLDTWLHDSTRAQPLLLDARAPEEFAVSHLRGARNAEQIEAALKDYPKDKPIVTYCAVGYRSSVLAEKLGKQGFTKVVNLEGSIFQWANEGRPIYKGEMLVKQVHPFDAKWGEMLKPEVRAPLP